MKRAPLFSLLLSVCCAVLSWHPSAAMLGPQGQVVLRCDAANQTESLACDFALEVKPLVSSNPSSPQPLRPSQGPAVDPLIPGLLGGSSKPQPAPLAIMVPRPEDEDLYADTEAVINLFESHSLTAKKFFSTLRTLRRPAVALACRYDVGEERELSLLDLAIRVGLERPGNYNHEPVQLVLTMAKDLAVTLPLLPETTTELTRLAQAETSVAYFYRGLLVLITPHENGDPKQPASAHKSRKTKYAINDEQLPRVTRARAARARHQRNLNEEFTAADHEKARAT